MVKQKPRVIIFLTSVFASVLALASTGDVFAINANTNFQVNVLESLTVSVTTPTTWASGDMDEFLRNPVNVSVTTNNSAGFTATMTAKTTNTSLVNTSNSSYTLPTLSTNSTRSAFPANYWGYSFDDIPAGSGTSTYSAMVPSNAATPITVLSSSSASSGSKDFYFGAKGNASLPAGTYTGIVVINVVSGTSGNTPSPVTPTDPATPNQGDDVAVYHPSPTGGSTSGTTTYTHRSTASGNTTTTTEVTDGNNVDLYASPQGVTSNTLSNIATNSTLATGLALAATIAATSGMFMVIAARREGDDDDEDESQPQNMI